MKRVWIDEDTGIIMRQWTNDEYKQNNPSISIFEKYWSFECPCCNFIPKPHTEKRDAMKEQQIHILHCGRQHKGKIKYRDHELRCLESKNRYDEKLGINIPEIKKY